MSLTAEHLDATSVISVGALVNQRLNDASRWNLALVQRDEVWDETRMRHLLDSLLAGYPIGAILLSRVASGGRELAYQSDGQRLPQDARAGAWQVLDGQQRINALYSVFTDQGRYGNFLLNMLMERPAPTPAQQRARKERSLPHILHVPPATADDADIVELKNRDQHVDLSRWAAWVNRRPDLRAADVSVDGVAVLLAELDPEFRSELDGTEREIAAENLRRLLRAWEQPSIPLLKAELDSPLDVLEVFTRINLGGVQIAGADVYFAGVKTFWHDAERRIDELLRDAPMLRTRVGALRFLSRLASRAVGKGDAIPLTIDRLAGASGGVLRQAMEELTAPDSIARERIAAFSTWYLEHSELGYGLHRIASTLWDDVLAWVAASSRADEEWWSESRDAIDAYLLGATLFRYRAVMGDVFRRVAFLEALDAGSHGEPFPLSRILGAVRGRTSLQGPHRRTVRSLDAGNGDRDAVMNVDGRLLTVLSQRIPYVAAGFDWDHIYPQALASRMWRPGNGNRRRHHPGRKYINSTGNFWALPLSANRALGATAGRAKFELLEQWMQDTAGERVWSRDRWSITPEEVEQFVEVDRLLGDRDTIEEAMSIFGALVRGRARRLFEEVLVRFPRITEFARQDDADAFAPTRGRYDYREVLQIQSGDPEMRLAEPKEAQRRLRERSAWLESVLTTRLGERVRASRIWDHRRKRKGEASHVVLGLEVGSWIELMFRWMPDEGARVDVKAYPDGNSARGSGLHPDFQDQPLGVAWSSTDDEIVTAFEAEIARLEASHPNRTT